MIGVSGVCMEAIARVFLIDGTSKPVRYDQETTVEVRYRNLPFGIRLIPGGSRLFIASIGVGMLDSSSFLVPPSPSFPSFLL